jgi:hypothetical protein
MNENMGIWQTNKYPFDGRIISIKMAEPKKFMNYCLYDSQFNNFFSSTSDGKIKHTDKFKSSLDFEICLIKSKIITSGTKVTEVKLAFDTSEVSFTTGETAMWNREAESALQDAQAQADSGVITPEGQATLDKLKALRATAKGSGNQQKKLKTTYNKASRVNIVYDGSNPSTARKDVKVDLTFNITDLNNLSSVIGWYENDIGEVTPVKLHEIITAPYGVAKGSSPGSFMKSQYSPDYNRLRLKVKNKIPNTTGKVDAKATQVNDLIIDLAIIDHQIERNADTSEVELKIHYRGYFEQLLSMPWMDALADDDEISNRMDRDEEIREAIDIGCDNNTLREIVRLNRQQDRIRAQYKSWSSILKRLFDKKYLISYSASGDDLVNYVQTGDASVSQYAADNFWANMRTPVAGTFEGLEAYIDNYKTNYDDPAQEAEKLSDVNRNPQPDGSGYGTYFFTLGSLMEVITDCLYEDGTANGVTYSKTRDHIKDDIRFIMAPIVVKDPSNVIQNIKFNPVNMPIDLYYFKRWFENNIVDKNITFMPVLTMIRTILERLLNDLMYEQCFGNTLEDERPPVVKTAFFRDTRAYDDTIKYESKYSTRLGIYNSDGYVDIDAFMSEKGDDRFGTAAANARDKIFYQDSSKSQVGSNVCYCVIYMSLFNNMIPFSSDAKRQHYDDEFIPTIEFGSNTANSFVKSFKFTKANVPGLRESRYFNTFNSLNILANVYDLTITFEKAGATTMLFPGQMINVILTDFDLANVNPHQINTLSNNMGLGGYYIIKKVTYNIPNPSTDYSITIETKWVGTEYTARARRRPNADDAIYTNTVDCKDLFNDIGDRVKAYRDQVESDEGVELSVNVPTAYLDRNRPPDFAILEAGGEKYFEEPFHQTANMSDPNQGLRNQVPYRIGDWFLTQGNATTNNKTVPDHIRDELTAGKTLGSISLGPFEDPTYDRLIDIRMEWRATGISGEVKLKKLDVGSYPKNSTGGNLSQGQAYMAAAYVSSGEHGADTTGVVMDPAWTHYVLTSNSIRQGN